MPERKQRRAASTNALAERKARLNAREEGADPEELAILAPISEQPVE